MKRTLEKYALLSLSFLLVATYSISPAVPQMRTYYGNLSSDQVNLLVSMPSTAVLLVVFLNIFFSQYLKERAMIIGGLILYVIAGVAPVLCHEYTFVMITRFLFGIGSGMVNTKAISVIGETYSGQEQAFLLGVRGSVEAGGNALLTFIAGILLAGSWKNVFWIYLAALPILAMYIAVSRQKAATIKQGVSAEGMEEADENACNSSMSVYPARKRGMGYAFLLGAMNMLFIGCNTVVTLSIPVFLVDKGIGTDTQSGVILSILIVAGIVSGVIYSRLIAWSKEWTLPLYTCLSLLGVIGICVSQNVIMMTVMAVIWGFCYTPVITIAFQNVAQHMPAHMVDRGTSVVLVGCNLGSSSAAYVMMLSAKFSDRMEAGFYVYGTVMLIMTVVLTLKTIRREKLT